VPNMAPYTPSSPARRRCIQYAAAFRFNHWRLWNAGSSAGADDESESLARSHFIGPMQGSCERSQPVPVIPREGGGSSTPRPFDSIMGVSGILDRPPSRAMTAVSMARTFAFPRHGSPGLCKILHPLKKEGAGKAGCWLAPAVSCARDAQGCAHEHTGSSRNNRPSLRNGFNGLWRALPGDEFVLSPSSAN